MPKKFLYSIFGIFILITILLSFSALTVFSNYQRGQKTYSSVNENYRILNENSELAQVTLSQVEKITEQFDSAAQEPKVEAAKQKLPDRSLLTQSFDKYESVTQTNINSLDRGYDSNTKEVYEKSKNILDSRNQVFNEVEIIVDAQLCTIEKTILAGLAMSSFKIEYEEGIKKQSRDARDNYSAASEYATEALDHLSLVPDCLIGELEQFKTESFTTDLKSDQKLLKDIIEIMNNLSQGLSSNGSETIAKINRAINISNGIENSQTIFFQNKDFLMAIGEYPSERINQVLQELEVKDSEFNNTVNGVYASYWFID